MKVLVTGATSLLGGAVAQRLHSRGDDVTVFQRRPSGLGLREVLGDVADRRAVEAAVAGAEVVIHAAARVTVVGSWSAFAQTNVTGTANMLDAARATGVNRFVYVSSPSVANAGTSLVGAPAGPADPDSARDNYSRSKASAELLALGATTNGFSVVAVRPHLVWGPGDTQLIGRIVSRARQGRLAVIGSGGALIDTTYIDNAADAIVATADHAGGLGGRAFVVSNGQPRPVRELLNRIAFVAGLEPPRLRVPVAVARAAGTVLERAWEALHREDDPPITRFLAEQLSTAHWFDQRETRRALGWHPAVGLDEGFARLESWFRASRAGDQP
ncbi:MAG: NAD-dependent epimerase/dehydratase family protein [Actinomycetota bacterium]|nr:NAD-dependent epimerase/dehydratase family protein [Actinomycetota bacterium]